MASPWCRRCPAIPDCAHLRPLAVINAVFGAHSHWVHLSSASDRRAPLFLSFQLFLSAHWAALLPTQMTGRQERQRPGIHGRADESKIHCSNSIPCGIVCHFAANGLTNWIHLLGQRTTNKKWGKIAIFKFSCEFSVRGNSWESLLKT